MKKTILALGVLALAVNGLTTVGCKKKNDNNNSTGTLVGKWEARSDHYAVTNTTTTPPTTVYSFDTTYAAGTGTFIEFSSNSKYIVRDYYNAPDVADSGNYAMITANKLVVTSTGASGGDTVNISLSGNSFTLSTDYTANGQHQVSTSVFARR